MSEGGSLVMVDTVAAPGPRRRSVRWVGATCAVGLLVTTGVVLGQWLPNRGLAVTPVPLASGSVTPAPDGAAYFPVVPDRLLDTRDSAPIPAKGSLSLVIAENMASPPMPSASR